MFWTLFFAKFNNYNFISKMNKNRTMQEDSLGQLGRYFSSPCSVLAPCSLSMSHFFDKNKVVPRSAVNPDHLEPFNCKGLFTTTHATKHRSPIKSVEKTWREQLVTDAHSSIKVDRWKRLPDRNSEPGSIGIGLVPSLRTLFYELYL